MALTTVTFRQLEKTGKTTWRNNYEIWNEEKRNWLNDCIYNRFAFREIGFQNPARFDFELSRKLEICMTQKYNRIFKLLEVDYNPLYNIDLTETHTETHIIDGTEKTDTTTKTTMNSNSCTDLNSVEEGSVTRETSVNETNSSNSANTDNSTNTTESSGSATANSGAVTMPDDIESTGEYFNDRQQNKTVSDSNVTATTNNNSTATNTNTLENNGIDDSSTTNHRIDNSSVSVNGTSNNSVTGNNESNTNETWEHTTKTLGSSAGLSFSNAIMQNHKMIELTNLLEQLFYDLEPLFLGVWNDVNSFD